MLLVKCVISLVWFKLKNVGEALPGWDFASLLMEWLAWEFEWRPNSGQDFASLVLWNDQFHNLSEADKIMWARLHQLVFWIICSESCCKLLLKNTGLSHLKLGKLKCIAMLITFSHSNLPRTRNEPNLRAYVSTFENHTLYLGNISQSIQFLSFQKIYTLLGFSFNAMMVIQGIHCYLMLVGIWDLKKIFVKYCTSNSFH